MMRLLTVFSTLLLLAPALALAVAFCPPNAVCWDNPLGSADFDELINKILDFAVILAVPISVFFILKGAFLLMTSEGNSQKMNEAWATFKWVFIGLAGVFLSKGLIAFLLSLFGG